MIHAAVFDAGKTRLKLSVVSREGEVVWSAEASAKTTSGPVPGLDLSHAERFLDGAMAGPPRRHRLGVFVPVGHGAAAVWIGRGGPVADPIDYEAEPPREVSAAYAAVRPPFAQTGSPDLPLGLNLGRQLAWMEAARPDAVSQAELIVPLPQYFAWRYAGVAACEVSSLGCHTDLWAPWTGGWSSLARRRGWDRRFAPIARADAVLGPAATPAARAAGLPGDCLVLCGAHDSNAALLAVRQALAPDAEAALVSTGTWIVAMAPGGSGEGLDPLRDCLVNVAIDGRPVPTSRFMGGREYARIAGDGARPTVQACAAVIARGDMVLPPVDIPGGPFRRSRVAPRRPLPDNPTERAAAAALYLAMATAHMLDLVDAGGTVVLDGPLARDPVAPGLIAALVGREVRICAGDAVALGGAALAFGGEVRAPTEPRRPLAIEGLAAYARRWLEMAGTGEPEPCLQGGNV